MQLNVIRVFVLEYLEEVPHSGSAERGKCLPANGYHEAGVLVAEFYKGGKYRVRLARSRPALVDLYPGVTSFDVVVCGGLPQLTSALSSVNHESGFFSATAISCLQTYPRFLPLVLR